MFSRNAADATQYAHYVFKTFKNGNTGTINFEVTTKVITPEEMIARFTLDGGGRFHFLIRYVCR